MSDPLTPRWPCEIVETDQFRDELKKIEPDAKRSDEFLYAATWALAKNPAFGAKITKESDIRGVPVNNGGETHPMVLYYTFSSEKIYLLGIELFRDQNEE